MKFLGNTKKNINEGRNSENVPSLEITESTASSLCYSRVVTTFVPSKSFRHLINVPP